MENSTIDSVSEPPAYICNQIKWKILARLPTKSLMRFKCVSRLFYWIIRNPVFVKEYSLNGGSFKGVLITDLVYYYQRQLDPSGDGLNRVFYAEYNAGNCNSCENLSYYYQFSWDLSLFSGATAIVKGLIGLYNDDRFTLCNVSTQEMVELPRNGGSEYYNYHLGFDPVREVYKVLKVNFHDEVSTVLDTQVFTVGVGSDLGWRNIHPAPAYCDTQSVCIGGRLYWMPSCECDFEPSLIAFDLASESFETIPIPDMSITGANVADISGSPALVFFISGNIIIWMKNGETEGAETWAMRKFYLPLKGLMLAGTLPTGEMLICKSPVRKFPRVLFKYEHDKHEMRLIYLSSYCPSRSQLHGLDDSESGEMQLCYHEENIVPLAPLLNIPRQ